jgi:hypothetical protein
LVPVYAEMRGLHFVRPKKMNSCGVEVGYAGTLWP